ncbi:PEBP-like protein [Thozetella sp. PMI_491]|nr:PEBP-like protein [Thozetella sp. PMI_491]
MAKESPSLKHTLTAAKSEITLRLHYPEVTVSEAAVNLTTEATKLTPTLSIATSALKGPETRYLAVSIDLDAPFPSFPIMSPILHGLHIDLVAGPAGSDGFAPLEGTADWFVPYAGPGPPKPSAAHRYVFMVFEQPEGCDAARIRKTMKFGDPMSIASRMRWDQESFEKKLGIGKVLAGNYYLTRG